MTQHVVMVEEGITVAEAVTTMSEKNVSSLIVNRKNEDDAYGIVTRRDVVNKVIAEGLEPQKVKVADIMTKPLLTIPPSLSIKHVARLMVHTGVRRMPVYDSRKIIGIVSNSDIFRGFSRYLSDEKAFLS
jgi:CBS domain-containing protein